MIKALKNTLVVLILTMVMIAAVSWDLFFFNIARFF